MRLIRCAARLSLSTSFQKSHLSSFHYPSRSRVMLIATDQQAASSNDASDMIVMKHYNNFLTADSHLSGESLESKSLVMINSATMDIELVRRLWKHCDYKICADGGANRLFDGLSSSEIAEYVPDAIKGDLDSLRDEVRDHYSALGCDIVLDRDQDHNDLDKCLLTVKGRNKDAIAEAVGEVDVKANIESATDTVIGAETATATESGTESGTGAAAERGTGTVIVLGAFGGRLDQEIANIHALFKWQGTFRNIVLLGGENVAYLLCAGQHECRLVQGVEGPGVSLLPLGGMVANISTTGLEWDLTHHVLEMGGLVSSSNRIKEGETVITVNTSDAVVFHSTLSLIPPLPTLSFSTTPVL